MGGSSTRCAVKCKRTTATTTLTATTTMSTRVPPWRPCAITRCCVSSTAQMVRLQSRLLRRRTPSMAQLACLALEARRAHRELCRLVVRRALRPLSPSLRLLRSRPWRFALLRQSRRAQLQPLPLQQRTKLALLVQEQRHFASEAVAVEAVLQLLHRADRRPTPTTRFQSHARVVSSSR